MEDNGVECKSFTFINGYEDDFRGTCEQKKIIEDYPMHTFDHKL